MFSKSTNNILFLTLTDPFGISPLGVSHCVTLSRHTCILRPHSDCLWVATSIPAMGVGLHGDTLRCIQVFLASSFIEEGRRSSKRQWFSLKGLGNNFLRCSSSWTLPVHSRQPVFFGHLSYVMSESHPHISLALPPSFWVILKGPLTVSC